LHQKACRQGLAPASGSWQCAVVRLYIHQVAESSNMIYQHAQIMKCNSLIARVCIFRRHCGCAVTWHRCMPLHMRAGRHSARDTTTVHKNTCPGTNGESCTERCTTRCICIDHITVSSPYHHAPLFSASCTGEQVSPTAAPCCLRHEALSDQVPLPKRRQSTCMPADHQVQHVMSHHTAHLSRWYVLASAYVPGTQPRTEGPSIMRTHGCKVRGSLPHQPTTYGPRRCVAGVKHRPRIRRGSSSWP
jgi:hypothetical protein